MNGTRAKALRRQVYPKGLSSSGELRDYHRMPDGSIQAMGFRRAYKDAKKKYRKCQHGEN